uniref:hypothetical protein n=1 Tax=Alloprevotella sp. TaxID=1872471 RepID=UPI003FEEDC80
MKFKAFIIAASMACACTAQAQDINSIPNLDLEEDSTGVASVSDIVKMQQEVLSNKQAGKHFQNVWKRRSFFNMSWTESKMKCEDKTIGDFKSDWGVTLQSGTNYRLHKKPIAKMINIALDYSWLNLNVNHIKAEDPTSEKGIDGKYLYNSTDRNVKTDESGKTEEYYVYPWNLEKYEANYGMTLGPSITIAPFVPLGVKQLDYLKIQAYYHIGYSASFLYTLNKEEFDKNQTTILTGDNRDVNESYTTMKDNLKLQWGHGMTSTFGFNIFWKRVGIGYERTTGTFKYKNFNTKDFGRDKTKFTNEYSRIYLTIRT